METRIKPPECSTQTRTAMQPQDVDSKWDGQEEPSCVEINVGTVVLSCEEQMCFPKSEKAQLCFRVKHNSAFRKVKSTVVLHGEA